MSEIDELVAKLKGLKISHVVVEGDCWYSCPKSGHCCNDPAGNECNCGADKHNARIDGLIAWVLAND